MYLLQLLITNCPLFLRRQIYIPLSDRTPCLKYSTENTF